jgi:hypothetical protein
LTIGRLPTIMARMGRVMAGYVVGGIPLLSEASP